MIKATHGVITNIRMDHVDMMGPKLENIAEAISMTIPKKSILFTSEDRFLNFIKNKGNDLGTKVVATNGTDVLPEEMDGFSYIEHYENVSLALAVCKELNADRQLALQAMKNTVPDEGVLRKFVINNKEHVFHFYNALAANDPESSIMLWNNVQKMEKQGFQKVILINTRKDRLERSEQLIIAISTLDIDLLLLTGENINLVKKMALRYGFKMNKIVLIGLGSPGDQYNVMKSKLKVKSIIFAIGNMGAGGAELVNYISKLSKRNDT